MESVIVNDVILEALSYRGQRIVTFEMVSEVNHVSVESVRTSYKKHSEHFIDGVHTHLLEGKELQSLKSAGLIGTSVNSLRVFTEMGYYLLIKPMRDPISWRVQSEMAETYFRVTHGLIEPSASIPLIPTMQEQIASIRDLLQLSEDFDLTDDHTRMIARETIQNRLRIIGQPYPSSQTLLPEKSSVSNYFQVEDLRQDVCKIHNLTATQWADKRGAIGKVIRASIQAADPSAEPIRIKKMVNGAEREVNGWGNGYKDIAMATIDNYFARQGGVE